VCTDRRPTVPTDVSPCNDSWNNPEELCSGYPARPRHRNKPSEPDDTGIKHAIGGSGPRRRRSDREGDHDMNQTTAAGKVPWWRSMIATDTRINCSQRAFVPRSGR
jgi:hypothetical protein